MKLTIQNLVNCKRENLFSCSGITNLILSCVILQSENIHSIRDALEGISVKEEVTGCVASNGVETEAWKQMSLEVLPSILILHMKRFVFDTAVNTIRKLDKRVDFSIDLEIAKGKARRQKAVVIN